MESKQIEQIADGLYVGDTTRKITISPSDIGLYCGSDVPDTLGRTEHEMLAGQFVQRAQKHGKWVGIARSGVLGYGRWDSELRGMIGKGYLELIEQAGQIILVPTQKLAETIHQSQHRYDKKSA